MLAYVVDSLRLSVCFLSTWAVFGGLLVDNNVAPEGRLPSLNNHFMLYAWLRHCGITG